MSAAAAAAGPCDARPSAVARPVPTGHLPPLHCAGAFGAGGFGAGARGTRAVAYRKTQEADTSGSSGSKTGALGWQWVGLAGLIRQCLSQAAPCWPSCAVCTAPPRHAALTRGPLLPLRRLPKAQPPPDLAAAHPPCVLPFLPCPPCSCVLQLYLLHARVCGQKCGGAALGGLCGGCCRRAKGQQCMPSGVVLFACMPLPAGSVVRIPRRLWRPLVAAAACLTIVARLPAGPATCCAACLLSRPCCPSLPAPLAGRLQGQHGGGIARRRRLWHHRIWRC